MTPALIAIGLLGGCALGYVLSRRLLTHLEALSQRPRLIRWAAFVGGLLALLPSGFLAFIFGGTFGGAMVERFLPWQLGFIMGIALVLAVGIVLGSALCAAVAVALTKLPQST